MEEFIRQHRQAQAQNKNKKDARATKGNKNDPYKVLNLQKNATDADVKKNYKTLAMKWHPDKNKDNTIEAEEKFKEITEAKELLLDKDKRNAYDQGGYEKVEMYTNMNASREQAKEQMKLKKCALTVPFNFSIEEYYNGLVFDRIIIRTDLCSACGTMTNDCKTCNGIGVVESMRMVGPGMFAQQRGACDVCEGSGTKYTIDCKICNNERNIKTEYKLKIDNVFKGVPIGSMVLASENEGNEYELGKRGQIILNFILNEGNYSVEQFNLIYNLEINLLDVLLGSKKYIKHPNGSTIIVDTSDIKLIDKVIPNMGLIKGEMKGDFIIKPTLTYPKNVSKKLTNNEKTTLRTILNKIVKVDPNEKIDNKNMLSFVYNDLKSHDKNEISAESIMSSGGAEQCKVS
jgi:DnaJ-class molecular chaperone